MQNAEAPSKSAEMPTCSWYHGMPLCRLREGAECFSQKGVAHLAGTQYAYQAQPHLGCAVKLPKSRSRLVFSVVSTGWLKKQAALHRVWQPATDLQTAEVQPRWDDVHEGHMPPRAPPVPQHILQLAVIPAGGQVMPDVWHHLRR